MRWFPFCSAGEIEVRDIARMPSRDVAGRLIRRRLFDISPDGESRRRTQCSRDSDIELRRRGYLDACVPRPDREG